MTTFPTETAALARFIRARLARLPVGRIRTALVAEADAIERRLGALTGSRAPRLTATPPDACAETIFHKSPWRGLSFGNKESIVAAFSVRRSYSSCRCFTNSD